MLADIYEHVLFHEQLWQLFREQPHSPDINHWVFIKV